jgi:predicted nucleic acid-binding protein
MMAVDSSSIVRYLAGAAGEDVDLVDQAIASKQLLVPPVVITEIMSAPGRGQEAGELLVGLVLLEVTPGYWERAGLLRARVLTGGHKARLGDALIAQSCLDHDVPLVTRDQDFRNFAKHGLRLLP